jgi:hypothetical protein
MVPQFVIALSLWLELAGWLEKVLAPGTEVVIVRASVR